MSRKAFFPLIWLSLAFLLGFTSWYFLRSSQSVVINNIAVPPLPALSKTLIAQGEPLYQQYCAACHGTDLAGAPDWKKPLPDGALPPPPHDDTGHTWHHPDFLLLQIMAEGGKSLYDGVMPGFATQLTQAEMHAILEFLKSHWSKDAREYQWWVTNTYPTPTPAP